jgi:hypothetical protein
MSAASQKPSAETLAKYLILADKEPIFTVIDNGYEKIGRHCILPNGELGMRITDPSHYFQKRSPHA